MRKTQGFQEKTQGIWQKTQGIWPKTWESANSELVNVPEFCPKKKACLHSLTSDPGAGSAINFPGYPYLVK